MNTPNTWRGIPLHHLSMILALAIASIITACEKSPPPQTISQTSAKKILTTPFLRGSVSNRNGLISTGEIELNDVHHKKLISSPISNGHYHLKAPENTELPLILSTTIGNDELLAVIVDPTIEQYDLSPLTTAIAKKAQSLGGYSRSNMVVAAESMINAPDANKTSTGFRGDPTTQYGGWH